jgi:hypothetical protein
VIRYSFVGNLHFKWGTKPNHTIVNAITIGALGGSFNSAHNDMHNIGLMKICASCI